MTPQPQQEYIITEEELDELVMYGAVSMVRETRSRISKLVVTIRSRPHTPAAPEPQYLVVNCPTAECPGNDCCSKGDECLSRANINDKRKQRYAATIRNQTLGCVCMKLNVNNKRIADDKCPKSRIKGTVTETCWKVWK